MGGFPGDCLGPWGPWGPFGQGSLRSPKQIKRKNVFHNIFENNFLLLCRAINPIIVKGWLNFGALVGYPLCGIVFCTFLIQILIRKLMFFLMATFQKYDISGFCSSNFLLCPSCFLLWPSIFLIVPHISCILHLISFTFHLISSILPLISLKFPLDSLSFLYNSLIFLLIPLIFHLFPLTFL